MLVGKAVRLPLRLVPKGTVVRVLTGELRGARWVVGAGTHGCWLGTYERLTRGWVCRLLREGQVAFDIGANVGFFTLLASRLVGPGGSAYAFEPLPENLSALRRHVDLNGCSNVHIVEAAVADGNGTERFAIGENPEQGELSDAGALEVRTLALDEAVSSRTLPEPDFLKIDVEGAELRVLEGARGILARKHPAIVLSAHGWRLFEACRDLLCGAGYRCEIARNGSDDGDYLIVAVARETVA